MCRLWIFFEICDILIGKEGGKMISYKGLWHLLIDRGVNKTYLNKVLKIHWNTIGLMEEGKSVRVDTLEKICTHFDVPIEKIIEIKKDPGK